MIAFTTCRPLWTTVLTQVDVKALQQQVEEKRARAFEEKQWELEQGACAVEWV